MNQEQLEKIDHIHSYPAKFSLDQAFSYIEKYSKEKSVVYDPFAGSGTTLLAASALNRFSFGTDINFIAVLITQFKLLDLTSEELRDLMVFIEKFETNYKFEYLTAEKFSYPSIDHWFCPESIAILSYIKQCISQIDNPKLVTFSNCVFSQIINQASNQESDTRYAAVFKPRLNADYVANLFIKKFQAAVEMEKGFHRDPVILKGSSIFLHDSKLCYEVVKPNSVDLILTSPPYPNTYDYYLYHKHRMNWLGYDVHFSMEKEIGSRREFSSLKAPKEKFDDDMSEIFSACDKVLKPGGYVALIMGDGKIRGVEYDAKANMEAICSALGWKLIDYSYSLLDDTSRCFAQSYRTKGKKEHCLVFQKRK